MTESGKPRPLAKAKGKAAAKTANPPAAAGRNTDVKLHRLVVADPLDGTVISDGPSSVMVTLRLPSSLKAALETAARSSDRTVSGVMRARLSQSDTITPMLEERVRQAEERLRLLTSAIRAQLPHEQIERLLEIHMESFKR
jgi:hypothetical protein